MAREIESAHEFEHQSSPWSERVEKFVARCDDGAVYEFERSDGTPGDAYRLVRRFQPDGSLSTSNGRLPGAVRETVDDVLPDWTK